MLELPLQTKRLILREYVPEDFSAIHEYGSDPDVVRYVPFGPNTEQDTRTFLQRCLDTQTSEARTEFTLAITLRAQGQLIGGCSLRPKDKGNATIGYVLNRQYWGQGYATETAHALLGLGFGRLALHRIFATCDVDNHASARVLEKTGMRREGHFREDVWQRGEWRSSYLYAILNQEWRLNGGVT